MTLKYEKTQADLAREANDLKTSPIMRFLKNQENFKFSVGDILIKQTRRSLGSEWETEIIRGVEAPKKFMYVFENELGIGYVKQLKVDGSGFTTNIVCTANFDPDYTKFTLDPDYVDHILVGDGEKFDYNKEYLEKSRYRQEAVKKNKAMMVRTKSLKKRTAWFSKLKTGDVFWMGNSFDELVQNRYRVTKGVDNTSPLSIEAVCEEGHRYVKGRSFYFNQNNFINVYITMEQPHPLSDPLASPGK